MNEKVIPKLEMLSEEGLQSIKDKALEVLVNIGSYIESVELLHLLEDAGAKVDLENRIAYLPSKLVENAIESAPSSFGLYNSDGEKTVDFRDGKTYHATCGYGSYYADWKTGETKECKYENLVEYSKLVEMLDAVDIYHISPVPNDKPAEVQDLYLTKAALLYTKKPFYVYANGSIGTDAIIKMTAKACGGLDVVAEKPRVMFNITTLSPLSIREDAWEVIREAGKYKLPIHFTSGPMAGATSPVTLAGELVQATAELLLHLVVTQVYSKGMPVMMGSWTRIFDMKFGTCTVGTPEFAMMRAAMAQIINSYDLPSGGGGCLTDSNTVDSQHGWEKFMTTIMPDMAGMNCVFGMGMISQLIISSPESLVLDAEIVDTVKRITDGIVVDEDHLAYDVIKDEARGSNFLGHEHTMKHFRSEIYFPKVTDRSLFEQWKLEGSKCAKTRAQGRIEELLGKYKAPVDLKIEEEYDNIIEETMKAFGSKTL
jgi:trimethylamine--corrinoid protein Co-methyltransferase